VQYTMYKYSVETMSLYTFYTEDIIK